MFCQTGLETQWLAAMDAKAHGKTYDVPGDLKREDLEREQAMKQSMLRLVVDANMSTQVSRDNLQRRPQLACFIPTLIRRVHSEAKQQ
jgi:hypothetical protein